MNREEIADPTGRSEQPEAEFNENRALRDPAEDPYERRVLEELEASRFFDPASVRWYRSVFSERDPGKERDLGDVEFLHERGLVVEYSDRLAPTRAALLVPTRAAVLVFGRPRYVRQILPRPVIDCQFIGFTYDEWSPDLRWTDRIVVEENLLQAWLTLAERYFRHAERPFSIDMQTMRRDDDPPGYVSFREAVINQLIHQDYGDCGRTPFVRFYRDRTVFWNPGDGNASTSELLDRTPKEVRNPLIAAAFRGIGLAAQAGTGIRAIFKNWCSLGHVPPVIRSDKARNAFELSLVAEAPPDAGRRLPVGSGAQRVGSHADVDRPDSPFGNMVSDHSDQVGDAPGDHALERLTARQRAIVDACDVPRSLKELMQRAGVTHRSHFRRKHLKLLLDAGIVRMTNPGNPQAPNQKYVLTDAGGGVRAG